MKLHALPCYCATLRQATRAVTGLYEKALAGTGLHIAQYTALLLMKMGPNLTTTELAGAIGVDQTTAPRTLALIRKLGLASVRPGADRREKLWTLTAKGEGMLRKVAPAWEAAQAELERRLGRGEAAALKSAAFGAASKLAAG